MLDPPSGAVNRLATIKDFLDFLCEREKGRFRRLPRARARVRRVHPGKRRAVAVVQRADPGRRILPQTGI